MSKKKKTILDQELGDIDLAHMTYEGMKGVGISVQRTAVMAGELPVVVIVALADAGKELGDMAMSLIHQLADAKGEQGGGI